MPTAKTSPEVAQKLAEQITAKIGASDMWNTNPSVWWSNMNASGNTLNTFFETLTNVIISQRIKSLAFDNPLSRYKSDMLALGVGEAEIYFNPQTGRDFVTNYEPDFNSNNTNNNLILDKLPDVREVFYRLNYGKQYQLTYSDVELANITTSWESFGNMIDGISRSLNASAEIDEFEHMRRLFSEGFNNGFLPQTSITPITDKESGDAFLVKARAYFNKFMFPSENYSAWNLQHSEAPVKTWSERGRVSIMLSADAAAVVDVYSLAAAFNIDKADFMGRVVIVDQIDPENKILAVLFDDSLYNVKNRVNTTTSFFNPATLKLNMYHTRTGIMSLSPFSNAIAFTTYTYTALETEPDDWATDYYKSYFTKTGNSYALIEESDSAPEFVEGMYYSRS